MFDRAIRRYRPILRDQTDQSEFKNEAVEKNKRRARCRKAIITRTPEYVLLRGSRTMSMFVIKRDGREEPVHFDKITARISKLAYGLNQEFCDPCVSRPTPRFKRFRAPRPARARLTAPLRAPHPARELVHESVAHPWTLRPRLTRPFRAPRPRADRFPVPARPLLLRTACSSPRRWPWACTRASPRGSSTSSPRRPPRP